MLDSFASTETSTFAPNNQINMSCLVACDTAQFFSQIQKLVLCILLLVDEEDMAKWDPIVLATTSEFIGSRCNEVRIQKESS